RIRRAEAKVPGVSNSSIATISARNRVLSVAFFMFVGLIAALLIAGVTEGVAAGDGVANVNFRHQAAEVFGVIGKVIQLRGVEVEGGVRGKQRCVAGIQ